MNDVDLFTITLFKIWFVDPRTTIVLIVQEMVEVLLNHDANIEKELGPSRNKVTPLMVAAYTGDLDICKLMVKYGALVESKGNKQLFLF